METFGLKVGFLTWPRGTPHTGNFCHNLSGPPRVSQSGVELEKNFECGFMASDDAYGSYKTYGKVRLKFGPP